MINIWVFLLYFVIAPVSVVAIATELGVKPDHVVYTFGIGAFTVLFGSFILAIL